MTFIKLYLETSHGPHDRTNFVSLFFYSFWQATKVEKYQVTACMAEFRKYEVTGVGSDVSRALIVLVLQGRHTAKPMNTYILHDN